jgi:hypothetical protein
MDKQIEKKALVGTLKLSKSKVATIAVAEEKIDDRNLGSTEDIVAPPPSPTPPTKPNFHAMYKELHRKFPEIINIDKPVLLAIGIRKAISKETGISGVIVKQWIAWYCRRSNYYAGHQQGAGRFNLDGSQAGVVTEQQQENAGNLLEKIKNRNLLIAKKDTCPYSDLSDITINDVAVTQ